MFNKLSEYVVNKAAKKGIIQNDEIEENIYGFTAFLIIAVNILTAVVIGILFNMILEIILFVVVFKYLRKYMGGSHAETAWKCYIVTSTIFVVSLLCIKFYFLSNKLSIGLVLCSLVVMWILAPVEAIKKPLNKDEYKVFRKRAHIVIIISAITLLALYCINNPLASRYLIVCEVAVFEVALFAVVGKIQILKYRRKRS